MVLIESWAILGEDYKSIQKAKGKNQSCELRDFLMDGLSVD
jgi:hypothetical protein